MPPELEIVREWLTKAANDLEAARRLNEGSDPLCGLACFLCQQAVEKSLKAFLEFHQTRAPRTHALAELLDFAERIDRQFESLRGCQWLTPYAVAPRYPGSGPAATQEKSHQAMTVATETFNFVLERLPPEVRP